MSHRGRDRRRERRWKGRRNKLLGHNRSSSANQDSRQAVYTNIPVCTNTYSHTQTHTDKQTPTHSNPRTHTHTHTHTHRHTQINKHAIILPYTYTHSHNTNLSYRNTYINCIFTDLQINVFELFKYMYLYIDIDINTYIYIHIYIYTHLFTQDPSSKNTGKTADPRPNWPEPITLVWCERRTEASQHDYGVKVETTHSSGVLQCGGDVRRGDHAGLSSRSTGCPCQVGGEFLKLSHSACELLK